MSSNLPASYARQYVGDVELVAHASIAPELAQLLETDTLYDWAADQPQSRALRGRAPVYVATLSSGETIVVRHAWHGGLLAPITSDRWRRPTRAGMELRKSLALLNGGIPTAPVLGYALYPAGPGLVRVDVVTRFIDNSCDLGAVLSKMAPGLQQDAALDAVRVLLAQLEAQHLVHRDLNVKNILVQKTAHRPVAYVIDVDTMEHWPARDAASVRQANVSRLKRSVRKWRHQFDGGEDVFRSVSAMLQQASAEADTALPPLMGFDD